MTRNMKKIFLMACLAACILPLHAQKQKLSKEEKAAAAQAAYEAALASINAKTFVLVPDSYEKPDGTLENNIDDAVFLSVEGTRMFAQGAAVCDNSYNNTGEATSYDVKVDKKGNVKAVIVVSGRMWHGTYRISMRKGNNYADVIFDPQGSAARKFSGPVVPLAGAKYNKRANPM